MNFMCGIAGFCNFKEDFEENTDYWNFRLEKMRAVLAHRGNDTRGRYLKKHIGLSHSRLAIRDILCGDQPMTPPITAMSTLSAITEKFTTLMN